MVPHAFLRRALRRPIPALCAAPGQRGCHRLATNGASVAETGDGPTTGCSRFALTCVRRHANRPRKGHQEMTINAIAGFLDGVQAHGATYRQFNVAGRPQAC